MKKTEQNALQKILAGFAKVNSNSEEEVTQTLETLQQQVKPLYSNESAAYIGQSILNFYAARIQPRLHKGENEVAFDARYREWRIKTCATCGDKFAYAWNYDGVKNCSMECLEKALAEIGLTMTRDRDLSLRYSLYSHPAIVPAAAFARLEELYSDSVPESFAE